MKYLYKKLLIVICLIFCLFVTVGCSRQTETEQTISSNLTDCRDDMACAEKISSIKFPLILSNFKVMAMPDLIEITYPLDEFRDVMVRKTTLNENNKLDIDRNYSMYPQAETLRLENGVKVKVRQDKNLIYVAYLTADSGYYSIYCPKGMDKKEIWQIYNVMAEVEAH